MSKRPSTRFSKSSTTTTSKFLKSNSSKRLSNQSSTTTGLPRAVFYVEEGEYYDRLWLDIEHDGTRQLELGGLHLAVQDIGYLRRYRFFVPETVAITENTLKLKHLDESWIQFDYTTNTISIDHQHNRTRTTKEEPNFPRYSLEQCCAWFQVVPSHRISQQKDTSALLRDAKEEIIKSTRGQKTDPRDVEHRIIARALNKLTCEGSFTGPITEVLRQQLERPRIPLVRSLDSDERGKIFVSRIDKIDS